MSQSRESKNKALVLKAFDTLFNQRDYVAAERFWSPSYIQHSARPGHCRQCARRLRQSSSEGAHFQRTVHG